MMIISDSWLSTAVSFVNVKVDISHQSINIRLICHAICKSVINVIRDFSVISMRFYVAES